MMLKHGYPDSNLLNNIHIFVKNQKLIKIFEALHENVYNL